MDEAFIIVSPDYPPHMGGVERYSWNLAGELKNRGYSVFVVSSSMKGEASKSVDERGVTVLRFPSLWIIPDRMPVALPTKMWKQLEAELEDYKNVKLIAQTNLYLLSLFGLRFAADHGIKSMMIIHGSNYVCLGNGTIDRLEHVYERWIVKHAKIFCSNFASVSNAGAEFAKSLGCNVGTIAYNAIDTSDISFAKEQKAVSLREKYCLEPESRIIAFAGRLIREKGVLQLVSACEGLLKEGYDFSLLMMGDGPLLSEIKKHANNRIVAAGWLPHAEVIECLKQSDGFILPSDSERFPTSLLEAAACGCYVIAAPYGGQQEAAELVNGFVMNSNSADDIAEACRFFLDNADSLTENAKRTKDTLADKVSWSKTADKIISAFKDDE